MEDDSEGIGRDRFGIVESWREIMRLRGQGNQMYSV